MRNAIYILIIFCINIGFFAPGLNIFANQAEGSSLSSYIFPNNLEGMDLISTTTQAGSPCFKDAEEFFSAIYGSGEIGAVKQIVASVVAYSSRDEAEKAGKNCLDSVASDADSEIAWSDTVEKNAGSYPSIEKTALMEKEGLYLEILYTFAEEYLIATAYADSQPIATGALTAANEALAAGLIVESNANEGELYPNGALEGKEALDKKFPYKLAGAAAPAALAIAAIFIYKRKPRNIQRN